MTPASICQRLKQVRRYVSLARSPVDRLSLAVLGMAPFDSSGIRSFFGRLLFPELLLRPARLRGLRLALNPGELTHIKIFDEVFRDNNYDLDLVPFIPDQIFDCGGHIGMFSLLALSRYPSVPLTIFEPNPHNVEWIRRQLQLNATKFEVVQGAVSVREGEAMFYDRLTYSGHLVDDTVSRSLDMKLLETERAKRLGTVRARYTVRVVDLPAMLRQRRPQRLLLKMDVEGEEIRIIPALFDVLPREAAVFFETHDGEAGWERAKQQFTGHGFAVERRRSILNFFIDGFALRH
jgi:FkbM family methyltransferase